MAGDIRYIAYRVLAWIISQTASNNITITSFMHQVPEPEISINVGDIVGSGEISVSQISDIKRHRDIHIEQYK